MSNRPPVSPPPGAVRKNIETVAALEAQFTRGLGRADRIADGIAKLSGSVHFVIFHLVWFTFWVVANTGAIPALPRFDPYPYVLLSVIVSCEAVLLSTFVLMKQNREARRNDSRDHLNLQIDMLAEREITKLLQMQIAVCRRLGIATAASGLEIQELSRETPVQDLAAELKERIIGNSEQT